MYINNQYRREGAIEPKKLFATQDITKQCAELIPEIEQNIVDMLEIIRKDDMPQIKVSSHCDSPYSCPLEDICWNSLPPEDDIFCLYSGTKKAYELMERGVLRITDIKNDVNLSQKQNIQVICHKSGKPHIDKKEIEKFLGELKYPLHFIDFETINPAIPAYENSRPFEVIPFQYSLFIVKDESALKGKLNSIVNRGLFSIVAIPWYHPLPS